MNDTNNNEKHFCKECGIFEYNIKNRSILLGTHIKNVHPEISYVDYIVKHEYNGFHPTCRACNKELTYSSTGFKTYCSRSCANSGVNAPMYGRKGDKSPLKGRKRSQETIDNVVKAKKIAREIREKEKDNK